MCIIVSQILITRCAKRRGPGPTEIDPRSHFRRERSRSVLICDQNPLGPAAFAALGGFEYLQNDDDKAGYLKWLT